MLTGVPLAVLACLAIASNFVGLLYIWQGKLSREHPSTIKRRFVSIALASSVSWLPAYFWATRLHQTSTPVHHLLGLRLTGLPRAVLDSLFLIVTLFAGPIVYFFYSVELLESRAPPPPPPPPRQSHVVQPPRLDAAFASGADDDAATASSAAAHVQLGHMDAHPSTCRLRRPATAVSATAAGRLDPGRGARDSDDQDAAATAPSLAAQLWLAAGDLMLWRNLVVAPLSEEFVFRACMVPLLVMEGLSFRAVVLLTPLFFGAAHLHHAADLVHHRGLSLRRALAMVLFQFGYTTLFGWLATFLFLRTGHLAAPVAAHVFCNWAGFPPFGDMAAHPRGVLLLLTTAAGLAAFLLALSRMTQPERFHQNFYYYPPTPPTLLTKTRFPSSSPYGSEWTSPAGSRSAGARAGE